MKKKTAEPKPKDQITPFTWIDAISQKKGDPMAEVGESKYPAFMVNRGLSYFMDTLNSASEMNRMGHVDNKLQYDYMMETVRSRKRFSRWGKKKSNEDVIDLMAFYKCSRIRAEEYLKLLTPLQVETVKTVLRGGTEN